MTDRMPAIVQKTRPSTAARRTASPHRNDLGGAPGPPSRSRSASAATLAISIQRGRWSSRPTFPRRAPSRKAETISSSRTAR
ncbi:hypothetical protein [Acrocarpospora catenulata]|uniref:hypothetical protein n=1 Tax=Acrocarpospora catenulata TaxID=2836182 RepID=UPI001BD9CB3B|nr:hypothetical protein [Acrocarpospora catenulata]